MSDTWLDIDDKPSVPDWHVTRTKPREPYAPARHNNSKRSKRRELIELKRALPQPQRDYLECLTAAGFHSGNAQTAMVLKGYVHDRSTYTRWRNNPRLQRAIELAEEDALDKASITAAKVLLRVDKVAEYSLDEIPLRDKYGNLVYAAEDVEKKNPLKIVRNPELALKATELLGKNKKLWGNDEDTARVTVQIVNLAGDQQATTPILDGEFNRVVEDDN